MTQISLFYVNITAKCVIASNSNYDKDRFFLIISLRWNFDNKSIVRYSVQFSRVEKRNACFDRII